jgi:DNA mismatch endonuclease (patch repair protein)
MPVWMTSSRGDSPLDIVTRTKRSEMMRAVGQSDTEEEQIVAVILRRLRVRFRRNVATLPGSPDFANQTCGWAIFVHGCFWHGHTNCGITKSRHRPRIPARNTAYWVGKIAENRRRDQRKARQLRKLGFRVLTVWGCSLRRPARVEMALRRFLDLVPRQGAR